MAISFAASGKTVYMTGPVQEVLDRLASERLDNSDSIISFDSLAATSSVEVCAVRV